MSQFIQNLKSDRVIQKKLRNAIEIDVFYSEEAGLGWLDGAPGSSFDVESFYKEAYAREYYTEKEKGQMESNFQHFLPLQFRRVEAIKPFIKDSDTLLEIGSGPGYFLKAIHPHCRKARGIELNQKEAEYAQREHGLDVRYTPLSKIEGEIYEQICLFQLLEHQPDPIDFLKDLKRLCNPKRSLIHIEVPTLHNPLVSLYSIQAFKDFWFQKPHLYYFTEKGLEKVCREAGLSVVSLYRDQETSLFNHYHWLTQGAPMKHRKFAVDPLLPLSGVEAAKESKSEVFHKIQALLQKTNDEYRQLLIDAGYGDVLFCTVAPVVPSASVSVSELPQSLPTHSKREATTMSINMTTPPKVQTQPKHEAATLGLDRFLVSNRSPVFHKDPFGYFVIDNYLPADFYAALLDQFPSPEWFQSETKTGNKRGFDTLRYLAKFNEFCAQSRPWGQLVEAYRHPAFMADLFKVVRPGLWDARGLKGLRPWHDTTEGNSVSRKSLPWEVSTKMDFQFSHMERDSFIQPHSDAGRKLVSIMLYLPPKEWKPEYGGATRFFRGRDAAKAKKWQTWDINSVPQDRMEEFGKDMEPFMEFDYRPNRLVVFLKSDCTFHDVPPLQSPAGLVRSSFNINVNMS